MDLPINYGAASSRKRKEARETYIRIQKRLCWHCKEPLDQPPEQLVLLATINLRLFPRGMLDHPIHLHHSRTTGLTLGAVHGRCNAYLWQYLGQ